MQGKVVDTPLNFSSLKLQVHWQWGNDQDEARAYSNLYYDPIYPDGAENDSDIGVSFDYDLGSPAEGDRTVSFSEQDADLA